MTDLSLTAIILTKDEEIHISRVIGNLASVASRIIVVDSFSTDETVNLAKSAGAEVVQHRFVNYATQFQWALDTCNITSDWILRIDADELLEADLKRKLLEDLPKLPAEVVGVNFNRKHVFLGRWIRFGGRYPLKLLRVWRRGHGRIENRWMDEHIVTWGGSTVTLKGGFVDHNLNDLSFFTSKHNGYATREALDVLVQKYNLSVRDKALSSNGLSSQASLKRFAKEKIYNRMPILLGPAAYFLWRYIFQLGFLDGRPGLIYHFLQGFWYRFLVAAKVMELELAIVRLPGTPERIRELLRLTGHDLNPEVTARNSQ